MKSWTTPTDETIEKALGSVKKESDRRYFFSRLKNPFWIEPLMQRGYFDHPPQAKKLPDGSIQFPFWPELLYLKNIAKFTPDQVVEALSTLPKVNNPHIYSEILEIALELPGRHSARLKDKMLEYARLEFQSMGHRYSSLLAYWVAEDQTAAALELSRVLIQFKPDSDAEVKRDRYESDSGDWTSFLKPYPKFESWDYREILDSGLRPLAQKEPFEAACMLIDVTASTIYQYWHPEQLEKGRENDSSEIWCRRLSGPDDRIWDEREALAHTMAFACEQVYEFSGDKVAALDEHLRNQRWRIFKRLRQHLFAKHPDEQTNPWIRDLILSHKDYDRTEYHYEFQLMVRSACEHFGEELLTKQERTIVFDTILEGPSKEKSQEWHGDTFTEELFERRRARFHRMQLRLFEKVLFGKYRDRFNEVELQDEGPIADEDYIGVGKPEGGFIEQRSPKSSDELAAMRDKRVLDFINQWEEEGRDENNWLVEITIEALAEAFQVFFRDSVMIDAERLQFWLENRGKIERPIYVRAVVDGMKNSIKSKNFDRLGESLEFCEWVLCHPDQQREEDFGNGDQSRDNPLWASSRRAVVDLIDTCTESEVNVPYSYHEQLNYLLNTICTQFDWRLDRNKPVILEGNDQLMEAINNTRSRALESLTKVGYWLKSWDETADLSMVLSVLENRFSAETKYPLTLPERAILGRNYARLISLDWDWAEEHRSEFYPQGLFPAWKEAFGCFLHYTHPSKPAFEVLFDEYEFAIQNLAHLRDEDSSDTDFADYLGHHVLFYYLWDLTPLNGEKSLLERFYIGTDNDHGRWAKLFEDVGIKLKNTTNELESKTRDRLLAFFEWRLTAGSSKELGGFYWWLEAECLEAEWRLDAFSRVLGATQRSTFRAVSIVAKALEEMLPEHTNKVVECFAKLTEGTDDSTFYVNVETAKHIIRAGLESCDEDTKENAEIARENLLRRGYFDLLNLQE